MNAEQNNRYKIAMRRAIDKFLNAVCETLEEKTGLRKRMQERLRVKA